MSSCYLFTINEFVPPILTQFRPTTYLNQKTPCHLWTLYVVGSRIAHTDAVPPIYTLRCRSTNNKTKFFQLSTLIDSVPLFDTHWRRIACWHSVMSCHILSLYDLVSLLNIKMSTTYQQSTMSFHLWTLNGIVPSDTQWRIPSIYS